MSQARASCCQSLCRWLFALASFSLRLFLCCDGAAGGSAWRRAPPTGTGQLLNRLLSLPPPSLTWPVLTGTGVCPQPRQRRPSMLDVKTRFIYVLHFESTSSLLSSSSSSGCARAASIADAVDGHLLLHQQLHQVEIAALDSQMQTCGAVVIGHESRADVQ